MREGGSYVAEKGKKPRRVEGTRDHPEGNRARDKDGNPLDAVPVPAPAAPTPDKAAPEPEAKKASKQGGGR